MSEPIRIPLANGKGFALVDAEDAEAVRGYSWYRHSNGCGCTYARGRVHGKYVYMHVLIMGRGYDHRDRDGLNNQRSNLRPATVSQNLANTRPRRRGGSRFKGVSWVTRDCRWQVKVQGRSLGYFKNEEDAARAYDRAARATWGEYAYLNYPEEQA